MTRARRVAEALTPEGLADRLAGLSVGARLFGDEVRAGDVSVPATHILLLAEDGFTRHDGSVLSVVSARDYELLGP